MGKTSRRHHAPPPKIDERKPPVIAMKYDFEMSLLFAVVTANVIKSHAQGRAAKIAQLHRLIRTICS